MSEYCEVTGLSIDNANKYNLIHSKMIGEFSHTEVSKESIDELNAVFEKLVKKINPHHSDSKKRQSLTNHLERSIGKKFKAKDVKQFGSSVTGLNIKGGDLDVCLIIPGADEKKVVTNISKVLRGQGMEDVASVVKAVVPVVKFKDPRSGLRVDISVNNTLAIYNTQLIDAYVKLDPKISDMIKIIKHWSFHRNITDTFNGTLSSYAWSILCLNYLISESIIPNLQNTENKTTVEINDIEYDISFDKDVTFSIEKEHSMASLVLGFFQFYSNWDWKNNVVSMRSGGNIHREDKSWDNEEPNAIDLINAGKSNAKVGKHHLPIEDPFDHSHDLSRVLTAKGELIIQNEILRVLVEVNKGTKWNLICETIEPERLADLEPEDLFHDLRNLELKDIQNMKTKVQGEINGLESKLKALEEEKSVSIRLANAMKGIIEETSGIKSEHKNVHIGLRERSAEIKDVKTQRDTINSNIVIPLKYIEEQLSKVYKRLTNELNVRRIPSLNQEISDFSWFFELQEMHKKATEAEALHNKYVELAKLQHKDIKKLEIYESQHDEVTSKMLENEPLLKDVDIGKNGIRSYDKRVYNINRAIHKRKGEFQKLRREIGRLDAWLRILKGGNKNKSKRRSRGTSRTEKVTSGPVTLGDLSDLLASASTEKTTKKPKKVSSKKAGMKKFGKFSAHRGNRGSYQRKD